MFVGESLQFLRNQKTLPLGLDTVQISIIYCVKKMIETQTSIFLLNAFEIDKINCMIKQIVSVYLPSRTVQSKKRKENNN